MIGAHSTKKVGLATVLPAVLFLSMLHLSSAALANSNWVSSARHINQVQDQHATSIDNGVRYGQLTPKEERKLRREQMSIYALERKMRSDGRLDSSELNELYQRLTEASSHINQLVRNRVQMQPPKYSD